MVAILQAQCNDCERTCGLFNLTLQEGGTLHGICNLIPDEDVQEECHGVIRDHQSLAGDCVYYLCNNNDNKRRSFSSRRK